MCFTLRLENVQSARFQIVERGQVILHPCVEQLSFAEGKDDTGEQSRIPRDDATLGLTVAYRDFKVRGEFRKDLLETVSQF